MALVPASVNLWKTLEVPYPETLSNSTGTHPQHSVDSLRKCSTNMVLDTFAFRRNL
jgi:hypothetical protein